MTDTTHLPVLTNKAVTTSEAARKHWYLTACQQGNAPERNQKRFYQIADIIEANPERYAQDNWGVGVATLVYDGVEHTCGTTACIAGHTAALAGCLPHRTTTGFDWTVVVSRDGEVLRSYHVAAAELGLTPREADMLFNERWRPRPDLTVPEALRLIGDGAPIHTVTRGAPTP